MNANITCRVLRFEEASGEYLDKVSGQRKSFKATRLHVVDSEGFVGVFTWTSDSQPHPEKGEEYTLQLRKFESSSTGATGIAVGYL